MAATSARMAQALSPLAVSPWPKGAACIAAAAVIDSRPSRCEGHRVFLWALRVSAACSCRGRVIPTIRTVCLRAWNE